MSYEGTDYFILKSGELLVLSPWDYFDFPYGVEYYYPHDHTNGSRVEGNPYSFSPNYKVVKWRDEWRTDHYGNKYAQKFAVCYEPIGDGWRKIG